MTTQRITPSIAETWATIRGDLDARHEEAIALLAEMQRLRARLDATLDHDLGLSRVVDTEQVQDFIASAAQALQEELETAHKVSEALAQAGESVSAAVQLLEVHKRTRHIPKRITAKKLKESRPLAAALGDESWVNSDEASE